MTDKVYTVKSNARRDARKQGLDPDCVVPVEGGFIIRPAATNAAAESPAMGDKATKLRSRLEAGWTPLPALSRDFGWQAHTVRGAISTLAKKAGVTIERQRVDGVTSYRVARP